MSKHTSLPIPPEKEFRAGTIVGSIWRTPASKAGTPYDQLSIRIQKRYKDDKDGKWKTSSYFQGRELPNLVLVAAKVHEYVTLREVDNTPAAGPGDSPSQ